MLATNSHGGLRAGVLRQALWFLGAITKAVVTPTTAERSERQQPGGLCGLSGKQMLITELAGMSGAGGPARLAQGSRRAAGW